MPLFEILHLRVLWNTALGNPFIDVPFPVTNDAHLIDITRKEVSRQVIDISGHSDNFEEDVESAKTPSGMDASRLLVLPVSTFFEVVASDSVEKNDCRNQ